MGKAAAAEAVSIDDTPKSLKAAMLIIELARTTVEALAKERDDARERIAELEGEVSELNETIEAHDCAETVVAEAVSVLQKLKAGRTAEATLDLDLIVARNDPGAKARTSTVAVMF